MDRNRLFGGNPLGVIVRLVLLSIVVGIVFHTLGITPENIFYRLQLLIRNVYELGFDAFHWGFRYFLLGAVVVVPVWLIMRVLGVLGGSRDRDGRR